MRRQPAEAEKELSIDMFPPISGEPRRLYFDRLPEFAHTLVERNYQPTLLASMPRGGLLDEQAYLKAKLQAVEEGTVVVSDAQLKALVTSLELYFGKKSGNLMSLIPQEKSGGVLEVLDWHNTRHTMRGNTTLAEARDRPLENVAQPDRKD